MADWADLHKGTVLGHPEDYPVLATYTLQLIGPRDRLEIDLPPRFTGGRFHLRSLLEEAEENLTDLLPPGFSVVIREWDEEEK